jgi:hypothetical protein
LYLVVHATFRWFDEQLNFQNYVLGSYPCMLQLSFSNQVGPSEGSRESSAAWPSAAARIENSATTQRL